MRMSNVPAAPESLLAVSGLRAWYGEAQALHGIDLQVARGQITTLLGRNGAGKTTTLRAIMGLMDRREGSIRLAGRELIHSEPDAIARAGVGYCPEERGIFASLSVEENLMLPPVVKPGGMPVAEIYRLFPNLLERKGSQGTKLSGGEQQMLAIARILRTGADLLLLDEPTEGLAPVIVEQIGLAIAKLKARGYTVLLVEQNFAFASGVSDQFYVIENGVAVDRFDRSVLEDAESVDDLHDYLAM
jgi:branched-chain amino acid transport system ATP-binding protein